MRNWTKVLPAVLAVAALLLALPFAVPAADQTRTRTMTQDQMHSVNGRGMADTGQYKESHMWAEQTANMGSTTQVKAGGAKTEMEKRGEGLSSGEPAETKTDGGDGSKGGLRK